MALRIGHRVRFRAKEYLADRADQALDPGISHLRALNTAPSPADELERRLKAVPPAEATITGFRDGGDYAHVRFDDGFECGLDTRFLERAPK